MVLKMTDQGEHVALATLHVRGLDGTFFGAC